MNLRLLYIFVLLTAFAIYSCNKEKEIDFNQYNIKAVSVRVENIGRNSATVIGEVNTDNGAVIGEAGIVYYRSGYEFRLKYTGTGINEPFKFIIGGLVPGTKYIAKAYATNKLGTAYSEDITFTTDDAVPPSVRTIQTSNVTRTSVQVTGNISDDGGYPVIRRGFCYSNTTNAPRVGVNPYVTTGSGIGDFDTTIQNLNPGTQYYIRAFAETIAGMSYGDPLLIRTLSISPPSGIYVTQITDISRNSASISVTIDDDGGMPITERGIVYSTSTTMPSVGQGIKLISTPANKGSFWVYPQNLIAGTRYYVRAYASNTMGTAYSDSRDFSTLPPSLPSGLSLGLNSLNPTTAVFSCSIGSDGGATISSRGIVYSTSNTNLVVGNQNTIYVGTTSNIFSTTASNLKPNTTYYVRMFANNSAGTSYSSTISFRTPNINVGDSYMGGVVVYILQPGDPGYVNNETHGLIAATNAIVQRVWGCENRSLSTSPNIGTGRNNTTTIVNSCNENTAARYCNDLVYQNHTDWFLPSYHEMQRIHSWATQSGIPRYPYWTSSQDSNMSHTAYMVNVQGGYSVNQPKSYQYYVLPVRNF